jgi:hypothetical protein
MTLFQKTLEAAEKTAEVLRQLNIEPVVVGAMALAAHHYARETEDLDLGIAANPSVLNEVALRLREAGLEVELRLPDGNDPLGGVIDVRLPGAALVQVVNFDNSPANGFPAGIRDAVAHAQKISEQSSLKVADLHSLIALKLYAGGAKSKLDVLELIAQNQPFDIDGLRARCEKYRLTKKLDRVLALAAADDDA